MKSNWQILTKEIWKFLVPVLYLLLWIAMLGIAQKLLGPEIISNNYFLGISLIILFMGIISQSTSWSVGGDKGIKGDSLGKYVEFHSGAKFPWDYKYYTANPEKAIKESECKMEKINTKVVKDEK